MPPTGEAATTAPLVVVSHPRDPGDFSGNDDVDVDDWLKMYERVSVHNRWDETIMLANLIYHLKGPARVFYDTNEEQLTSWDLFKEKLRELFSKSVGRQLAAKQDLSSRAQSGTESYVTYIQDVLALCLKVDAKMPESDKVGHVLKGIADDAFHLLMCKECTTVESIIKECRRFEEAKCRRIAQQFTRLPHTAATSSCADVITPPRPPPTPDAMPRPDNLTKLVRREIEAALPATLPHYGNDQNLPAISLIQAVVREEVANLGLHSVCAVASPDVRQGYPAPFVRPGIPRRYEAPPRYLRRSPTEWRTPDDRPICFNCSRVGHVARYCRERWTPPPYSRGTNATYSDDRPYRFTPGPQQHYFSSSRYQPQDPNNSFSTSRFNRSPSPQRRQSRSPPSRRSPSPANYAQSSPEN